MDLASYIAVTIVIIVRCHYINRLMSHWSNLAWCFVAGHKNYIRVSIHLSWSYDQRKERVQKLISPAFDVPELQSMGMPAIVIDLSKLEGGGDSG